MANRRKSYEDNPEQRGGVPCRHCGCRHSYVVRTERFETTIRRTRRCRNCGCYFYTMETTS